MHKNMKKTLKQFAVAFLAGLLSSGQYAFAGNGNSVSASAVVVPRVQYTQAGFDMPLAIKGVKSFEVFGTATGQQVVDEAGKAPTTGTAFAVIIGTAATQCWAVIADSVSVGGITEQIVGKALIPPVFSTTSNQTAVTLTYPVQFHYGLVLYVSSALCRANVLWAKNGGSN